MNFKTVGHCAAAAGLLFLSGCAVSPKPLGLAAIDEKAKDLASRVVADQEPVAGPIDLYEAIARALKYNLDHRLEEMQAALRIKELDLAHFSLLPNVVANSGYAARNNFAASNSVNVLTGQQSLATSTSQDKRISTADVAFGWNVLDFGLSYVRARQAADTFLLAKEMRRKVAHRVVEDVRTAFWRAVSADRLLRRLSVLERRVARAQENSRDIFSSRSASPMTAVTYQRELVEIKRTIQELQRDLSTAHTQLSSLMNLAPGSKFVLSHSTTSRRGLKLTMPVREMISTAVRMRPELREVWYKSRINEHDLDAALLELLPGFNVLAGANFDSNEFLYNSNWLNWGAKASWNLIKLVQYPARRRVLEAQADLLDQRALALTMAVATQVHISRVRFYQYRKEVRTATEFLTVQRRLVRLMRAEAAANRVSEQTLIREEMNTLVAEVKRDIAYAGLQNAFANVHASIGIDPLGESIDTKLNVKGLATHLRGLWFERGDLAAGRLRIVAQK